MREYVSNNVQKFRNDTRLTQEELAGKLGVSRQTIVAIEGGNYTPSVLLALKIAKFFKKPLEELFQIAYDK